MNVKVFQVKFRDLSKKGEPQHHWSISFVHMRIGDPQRTSARCRLNPNCREPIGDWSPQYRFFLLSGSLSHFRRFLH
jgi:hypothetical protein